MYLPPDPGMPRPARPRAAGRGTDDTGRPREGRETRHERTRRMTKIPFVPWYLDCEPRPVQIEALTRSYYGLATKPEVTGRYSEPILLAHHGNPAPGWGHFMEMRLGKTPTALNEFEMFRREHDIKQLLVVAPNRYTHGWASEIDRFMQGSLSNIVMRSDNRPLVKRAINRGVNTLIVAYESLVSEANRQILFDFVDDRTMVVADESVKIKNRTSNMFKTCQRLANEAAIARALTGWPTPQAPYDLWSQLRFLGFLEGMAFHAFKFRFTKMGGFKMKMPQGLINEDLLNNLLFDMSFRARRKDWGTKLESDYEEASIDMLPEQKAAYHKMEQDFVYWLTEETAVTASHAAAKHMKLQQISSGFIRDEAGEVHEVVPIEKTPKLMDLVDRLDNEINTKVIVMAYFRPTIERLMAGLTKYKPCLIAGNKHMKQYGRDVETEKTKFNSGGARVLVAQVNAVKYGHNLMGSPMDPCHDIVYFENSYNLDDRIQSEERPQGEGQQAPINILDYFSSPVERAVVRRLQQKKDVASALFEHYKR